MGDKSNRQKIEQLEKRLDDLAVQFESIVKLLGTTRKALHDQQQTIVSLQRQSKTKT